MYKLTGSGDQWTESVLYAFAGDPDGAQPYGGVVLDNAGNLYGTTYQGGKYGYGTVFELTPSSEGWTKTTLYRFTGGADGGLPVAGLFSDSYGNFYGSTTIGGDGAGTVFEISPASRGWNFSVLYSFVGGYGGGPYGPLTMDAAGHLYGTTVGTGSYGAGVVFELSPSGDGWTYIALYTFTDGTDGGDPESPVLIAPSGKLYGTTYFGGNFFDCPNDGCGVVWEITP